jgi:hypothetical protein
LRYVFKAGALDPDLVFFLFFSGDGDPLESINLPNQFFADEILDLDGFVAR